MGYLNHFSFLIQARYINIPYYLQRRRELENIRVSGMIKKQLSCRGGELRSLRWTGLVLLRCRVKGALEALRERSNVPVKMG